MPNSNLQDVTGHGWDVDYDDQGSLNMNDEFKDIFKQLGPDWNQNFPLPVRQTSVFSNSYNDELRPLYTWYDHIYNFKGGVIVRMDIISPASRVKQLNPLVKDMKDTWREQVPDIHRWSDVTGVVWRAFAKQHANRLRYIFSHQVTTKTTRDVMEQAARNAGYNGESSRVDKSWPGFQFNRGSDEFKALLGTTHANGIVRLLVDNGQVLEGKSVESVTVFTTGNGSYHLLYTLSG